MLLWAEPFIEQVGVSYHFYDFMTDRYCVCTNPTYYTELDFNELTVVTRTFNNIEIRKQDITIHSRPVIRVLPDNRVEVLRHRVLVKVFPILDKPLTHDVGNLFRQLREKE